MYHIEDKNDYISSIDEVDIKSLKCHENVIQNRVDSLIAYLKTQEQDFLISSILVCKDTNTIIDGHHRYHALFALGFSKIPVTFINYRSSYIKAHFNDSVQKNDILNAANSGVLLPPKSSKHIVYVKKIEMWLPIILISSICLLKK
jgi:hypothetical protein